MYSPLFDGKPCDIALFIGDVPFMPPLTKSTTHLLIENYPQMHRLATIARYLHRKNQGLSCYMSIWLEKQNARNGSNSHANLFTQVAVASFVLRWGERCDHAFWCCYS